MAQYKVEFYDGVNGNVTSEIVEADDVWLEGNYASFLVRAPYPAKPDDPTAWDYQKVLVVRYPERITRINA